MPDEHGTGAGGRQQHAVAIAAGFGICLVIALVSGRREPWDSSLYSIPQFLAGIMASRVGARAARRSA